MPKENIFSGSIWGEKLTRKEGCDGCDEKNRAGNKGEIPKKESQETTQRVSRPVIKQDGEVEYRNAEDIVGNFQQRRGNIDMIDIRIDRNADTTPEALGILRERAEEIVKNLREEEIAGRNVADTLKWACFSEQLNTISERVFAILICGGDAFNLQLRQILKELNGGE